MATLEKQSSTTNERFGENTYNSFNRQMVAIPIMQRAHTNKLQKGKTQGITRNNMKRYFKE